jgi:hypothetical protein
MNGGWRSEAGLGVGCTGPFKQDLGMSLLNAAMNITPTLHRHHRYHGLAAALLCCATGLSVMPAQTPSPDIANASFNLRNEEDWKALPEATRAIVRQIWEVPLYLLSLDTPDTTVHPRVLEGARSFDEQYFEHLELKAQRDDEFRATKAGAEVDAVKARYTIGKLKVETRQSVWVWALWIPFNEQFQATEMPASLVELVPAFKGKITRVTSEGGKDFYISESGSPDGHVLLRQAVATDTGVLLWGLKGNPLTSGVAMSSQIWLNRGWFRSAEIGRK